MSTQLLPDLAAPVAEDLGLAAEHMAARIGGELQGARFLITGGTGFLGSWVVDLLRILDTRLGLGLRISLLTRDRQSIAARRPDWLADRRLDLLEGDVRHFDAGQTSFTHVIHGAADVSRPNVRPLDLADAIVGGSRHVLDIAMRRGARRYLYFSSGAVLGPLTVAATEDTPGAPPVDDPGGYANAKRFAEHLHLLATTGTDMAIVITRGFAFVGPRMPLAKFAIGNFIRDALLGRSPHLNSAGTALRAYLYAADAAEWLLSMLVHGRAGRIYNVGADLEISIGELAGRVARVLGGPAPHIPEPRGGETPSCYVPDIRRAADELGLTPRIDLDEAIRRTAHWALASGAVSGGDPS